MQGRQPNPDITNSELSDPAPESVIEDEVCTELSLRTFNKLDCVTT